MGTLRAALVAPTRRSEPEVSPVATPVTDLQQALDHIGFGRFHRRLLVICGLAWAADAAEVLLIGFALPQVIDDLHVSSLEASLIVTATFLGMMTGAWVAGPLGDRIGRKTALQAAIVCSSVFGGLTALSPDGWWLAALRAVTGLGLGAALPLNFALVAELLPRRNRGRNLVLMEAFWALGTVFAAGLAWLIMPTLGWRWLLASTALTIVVVVWIRRDVPESPRFLATAGRRDDVARVLARIAAVNGRTAPPEQLQQPTATPGAPVKALWRPAFRRKTAMLWVAWYCIALGYYGLFTWLPTIFVQRGFEFVVTYRYTFLLAVAQVPGYLSAAWLIERWGRPRTLGVYLAGGALCTYAFVAATTTTGIVAAAVLMSFFALGAWGALYAYTPELYPTAIRATGTGWASGMTRIAGATAPVVGGYLLPVSLAWALSIYAAAFAVAAGVVLVLGPETRDEPLQDQF
jgi:MFS transporter, putative metabolite:H+ symporter